MDKQSFQVPDLKNIDTVEARNLRLQSLDKRIDMIVDELCKLKLSLTFKAGWFKNKTIEYNVDYGSPDIRSETSRCLTMYCYKLDENDFDIYINSFEKYLEDTWNVNLFKSVTPKEYHTFMTHSLSELGIPMRAFTRGIIPEYKDFSIFIELKDKEVPRFHRIKFCLLKAMSESFYILHLNSYL